MRKTQQSQLLKNTKSFYSYCGCGGVWAALTKWQSEGWCWVLPSGSLHKMSHFHGPSFPYLYNEDTELDGL